MIAALEADQFNGGVCCAPAQGADYIYDNRSALAMCNQVGVGDKLSAPIGYITTMIKNTGTVSAQQCYAA